MNRDMIMLLKSIYKNANERSHHILKLDQIVAAYHQNKLQLEHMMDVEEGLLKDKVSQVNHLKAFIFLSLALHCSIGVQC